MKKYIFLLLILTGCGAYKTPEHYKWGDILAGATMSDMTPAAMVAKRPVYLGSGEKLLKDENKPSNLNYGDKLQNDNLVALNYMTGLEYELYDSLRKSGISVQRAGTDVLIVLIRTSLIELNAPEISDKGSDTLNTISDILKKYNSTYIEIAGYTDSMTDSDASQKLSDDMARRVALYLAQDDINPVRMFITGRGSSRPIAAQDSMGRQTNRRVEIKISPVR